MAHVSKTAVSRVIAEEGAEESGEGGSGEPKTRSRDDFKKQKELEEARKLGNAPAAVDEEGKDINPHIPQYISDAPWYLDPKGPTLKHQRPQEDRVKRFSSIKDWYRRGVDSSKVATKYRKGACENCGAMTHKKRDCLERPRKVGAKFSGSDFAPDEHLQPDLALDFDGKRDRWNGYDPASHREVLEEHAKMEEVKRELKKEKLTAGLGNPEEDDGAPSSGDEDEDKYVDKMDMPGTKVDAAERYTVRNLRIREDTAKYLRNLDPDSAYYDPKTRAMRKNPYEGTGRSVEEVDYAGDNFVRVSGDTVDHAKSTLFAWEAGAKGLDVHSLAEPTKLEALRKEYTAKREDFKGDARSGVLDKYGGAEHLKAPPRELIFSQTEDYVEYTRHGKVLRGEENPVVRSRYEEDRYPGNHTSVWGSHWSEGRWGYHCCHSFVKNSYCTGAAGKKAGENNLSLPPPATSGTNSDAAAAEASSSSTSAAAAAPSKAKRDSDDDDSCSESGDEAEEAEETRKERAEEMAKSEEKRRKKREKKKRKKDKKKKKKSKKKKRRHSSSSSSSSSDEDDKKDDFESKVKAAMKKQEEDEKRVEKMMSMDERKRPYNSGMKGQVEDNKTVTEEEMEAYYRKRQRQEDPMAQFMSKK